MDNIFFALIAIGALFLDIILCRSIFDEIEEEGRIYKRHLEDFIKKTGDIEARGLIDKLGAKINRLKAKAEEAHSSEKMWPFVRVIVILSICIIVSFVMNILHSNYYYNEIILIVYNIAGILGNIIWILILIFYIRRLLKIAEIYRGINKDRKNIRDNFDKVMTLLRLRTGDISNLMD